VGVCRVQLLQAVAVCVGAENNCCWLWMCVYVCAWCSCCRLCVSLSVSICVQLLLAVDVYMQRAVVVLALDVFVRVQGAAAAGCGYVCVECLLLLLLAAVDVCSVCRLQLLQVVGVQHAAISDSVCVRVCAECSCYWLCECKGC
jgi:hypothetical protein